MRELLNENNDVNIMKNCICNNEIDMGDHVNDLKQKNNSNNFNQQFLNVSNINFPIFRGCDDGRPYSLDSSCSINKNDNFKKRFNKCENNFLNKRNGNTTNSSKFKFSDHFKNKNQLFNIESSFSGHGISRNDKDSNRKQKSLGDSPFKNLYCQCKHHMNA